MSTQGQATERGGERIALGRLVPEPVGPVDPASHPDDRFAHYSVEAFAAGQPTVVAGAALKSGKQAVEPSDVLLSKIVAHPRRAWVVGARQGRRQVASNDWIVLRSPHHDPGYLRHLLVSNRFHIRFMQSLSRGGKARRARASQIASIEIPLPSLSVQRGIAQVLDDTDALRAKRRAMIAALDALPQAMFSDMFGDFSTGRSDSRLTILADCLRAAPALGAAHAPGGDAGWLMLRAAGMRDGIIDLTDTTYVNVPPPLFPIHALTDGDLLLARTARSPERLGDCCVVYPGAAPWTFDPELIRLRFDRRRAEPEFVRQLFRSPGGRTLLARATRRSGARLRVDPRALAALVIPLPPIEQQRELARRVAAVEPLRISTLQSGAALDALIGTLRDRAFEGELHLA